MKHRKFLFKFLGILLVFVVIAVIISVFTFSKKDIGKKQYVVQQLVYLSLKQLHYHPKPFDDKLSEQIFNEIMKNFDYGKRFFLKSDYDTFSRFKYFIDDLIKIDNLQFFNLVKNTYVQRLSDVEGFYQEILDQPFDFSKQEYLELDPKKLDYAQDLDQLKERWRKILKYETLLRLSNYLDEQEQARKRHDTTYKYQTLEQLEAKARKEVKQQYKDWFDFMKQMTDNDYFSIYINSITMTFDPHTQYFPPKREEDFQIFMSGKLEGIGATLQYKNGEIRVVKIIPGGAAWRQGELEVGDVILKVAQDDQPPVSVVGMRLDDAVRLIRGPKGTKVRLTVRKIDGTIKEISIIRDVVIIEDTYVRSMILTKPGSKYRFGYILIPSFYADFQHPKKGRRVFKDLRKELLKLKDQKIDGLIIDLRNNGGGSLIDVVKMVGMFIKRGPVVQVRDPKGKVQILKDKNDSIYYKGPLLVMVNEFSASASEIFAAAIQDYRRGVIFGAKHTFGKGTVQNMVNFDEIVKDPTLKPLGALKITIQKFYRINGGSTQLKGVVPDIVIPTQLMYVKTGERQEDYPLPWDEIKRAKYKPWHVKYNVEKLKEQSRKRVENDSIYTFIKEYARNLKNMQDQKTVPLNLNEYRRMIKQRRKINKKFAQIRKMDKGLIVRFLRDDSLRFKTDTIARMRYKDWQKTIKRDIDLPEAVNVLTDMVKKR